MSFLNWCLLLACSIFPQSTCSIFTCISNDSPSKFSSPVKLSLSLYTIQRLPPQMHAQAGQAGYWLHTKQTLGFPRHHHTFCSCQWQGHAFLCAAGFCNTFSKFLSYQYPSSTGRSGCCCHLFQQSRGEERCRWQKLLPAGGRHLSC